LKGGLLHGRQSQGFGPKSKSPNKILRSAVPFIPSAFHRLLEPLDRRVLSRIIEAHRGNRGVGSGELAWTCQRHLKALLFAQFAGLKSLREIEEGLAAHPSALYHVDLRPAKRSTLSDASAARPAAVFREIAEQVMASLGREARREGQAFIRLIDGSPIPIRDGRFTWAEADARCRGLKLHMVYDPRAVRPVRFAVVSPRISEISVARTFDLTAGTTYVFDKGYTDYGWWQDIVEAKAIFVTRLKSNARRRDIEVNLVVGDGIIADQRVKIGHKKPRGGAVNPLYQTELREIVVARDGKSPLHLLTNDHTRPALEIAALYKERWQIELFFKWIKQNLKVSSVLGRSENAEKVQIYVALIAFCLLRLFQVTHAIGHSAGAKSLLARLKVALFDAFDLSNRTPTRPRPPQLRTPCPQLSFDLLATL
jgi:hypothetical protein